MHEHAELQGRDGGFTLTEVLIVMVIMGTFATVLAATFSVIARNTPAAEARTDAARSVQGLVTWLPEDVDATPPDGFSSAWNRWDCAGSAPGKNVLHMTWVEPRGTHDVVYAVSYQYVFDGAEWAIGRYSCDDSGTGVMGPAAGINLTAELPVWDDATPPTTVTFAPTSGAVETATLSVGTLVGVDVVIDAAPKNPDETLPPLDGVTSDPPDTSLCHLQSLSASPSSVQRKGGGNTPRLLRQDVDVTLVYAGTCAGLVLEYDTGDGFGLRTAIFPEGSPSTITLVGDPTGSVGWLSGNHTLTASTTSDGPATSPATPIHITLSVS